MTDNTVIFAIFLIFSGAAILSTVALYTRQSLLVAYMLLGILLGPWGLKLFANANMVHQTGDIGIIFLLFLLGLNLHPQDLVHMFRKTFLVTIASSAVFLGLGFGVTYLFGFSVTNSLIVGVTVIFSSTIIGLKLLPTTVLHHQHTGELVISILLMQDLIAIFALFAIHLSSLHSVNIGHVVLVVGSLPLLFLVAYLFVRFVLMKLFSHFDQMHEYMFLLAIAWCLSMSELAKALGLSYEVGAFIAGVTIAASPISLYIAESLKPIRDFFLVLFFFAVGASFNLHYFPVVVWPALVLSLVLLIAKPLVYRFLLRRVSETRRVGWEVGFRLGQTSSFSLLIAYLAASSGLISNSASYLVQATTIITFIVSSYIVVLFYPTPIAISDKLRRD